MGNVGRKLYMRVDISKKNALGRTMNNVCCAISLKNLKTLLFKRSLTFDS